MREYHHIRKASEDIVMSALNKLIDKNTDVEGYRNAFYELGRELGKNLMVTYNHIPASQIMLVCASEDADWLASGVEEGIGKGELKKSVYWGTREVVHDEDDGNKVEISPIVKAYEEPIDKCELLVVVKSIISTSCVVKTQLTRLIGKLHPEHISILSPVLYKDGIDNLKKEFPEFIADKFHFIYFAMDDERRGSEVVPGIGGMVYSRLGLGNIDEKNNYIPRMVLNKL